MIKKTEIVQKENNKPRIVFYDECDDSFGYKLEQETMYKLYLQLKELYKDVESDEK